MKSLADQLAPGPTAAPSASWYLPQPWRVVARRQESPDTVTVDLAPPDDSRYSFRPGQFSPARLSWSGRRGRAPGTEPPRPPRGLIYHRYRISADGTIAAATIIPPTSQNQRVIESDLRSFATARLGLSHDQLTSECEQAVRSYDPCISCAAHFLDLTVRQI